MIPEVPSNPTALWFCDYIKLQYRCFMTVGFNCVFRSRVFYSTRYTPVWLIGIRKYSGERIELCFILMSLSFPEMEVNTWRFTAFIVINLFPLEFTVKKLVLLILGYCLQQHVMWNVFKIIDFQLLIPEKLKWILTIMLICVIKIFSFLIVYATREWVQKKPQAI